MWFREFFPDVFRVSPVPGDEFILNEPEEWALIMTRGRVIGYCARAEVWEPDVTARDGPQALRRLGLVSSQSRGAPKAATGFR